VVPIKQNLWETILIRFALPDFPQVPLDFGQMSLQIKVFCLKHSSLDSKEMKLVSFSLT